MKDQPLLSEGELSRIAEWIDADGDILVSIEYECSRLSADSYLVRSVEALGHLIAATRFWPHRANIHVFRGPFPVRGTAGPDLLRRAEVEIREGTLFHIVDPRITYPMPIHVESIGQTTEEIEECFRGPGVDAVAIGRHPMDWTAEEWERAYPDSAIRRIRWSGSCADGACQL